MAGSSSAPHPAGTGRLDGMSDNPEFDRRLEFFAEAAGFTPFLGVVDTNGAKFIVQTSDETVGRSLFLKGSRGEYRILETTLEILEAAGRAKRLAGTTFLDIGANIGTTTVAALQLHGRDGSGVFARAIACEPEPTNVRLLKLNTVLNDIDDRVRVFPVALSDEIGTATLLLHPRNSGAHAVQTGKMQDHGFQHVVVEQVTFDHLVERGLTDPDEVGIAWMDVQGHEGHVLNGAQALMRRGVPVVFEFYPNYLRLSGGLAKLHSALRDHYTHFVDLRAAFAGGKEGRRPVRELKEYSLKFGMPGERKYTDLLVMRLKSARR
jgi:FkbM family methyltransferase